MSCERIVYRRELAPGITLEATLTEFREGADYLDTFTLTAFGVVTDLLPDALKGTEDAFSALGEMEGALYSLLEPENKVDARELRRAA